MEDYTELHIFQDDKIDFFAVICLHSPRKKSAIGGCRFIEYSSKDAAIEDAIRLSSAMRSKAIISELPHDGGKAVIKMPTSNFNREVFLKKFAECVESLNGKYIATIDSGTTQNDMSIIKKHTSHVVGYLTGTDIDSNPSDSTALGVYNGMRAAVKIKYGVDSLKDMHVAIQGIGNVGSRLVRLLHKAGARITITDINYQSAMQLAEECKATFVSSDQIYRVKCDIFSPCALGRTINHETIKLLQTKIIAGAANNQLSTHEMIDELNKLDILYIPDYLLNAGGLIHLALQMQGKKISFIEETVKKIGDRILNFSHLAKLKNVSLFEVVKSEV